MENNKTSLIGKEKQVTDVKIKYCLYARKSTESDEKQALSIDSQVKEMLAIAERDELEIIDIRREAHSAKDSGQRPVFKEILEDIRRGRYNGIITWAPDRLSRNAGDLGSLVDLMDQKLLIEIRTYGQQFKNSPNEKFLLMILCSQAKLENDNKSINVRRGLKARVEMGLWPAPAPTGYLKDKNMDHKCEAIIDPDRAPIIKQIFEKVAYEKWSGRKVYHWLKFDLNFKTVGNKNLTLGNLYVLFKNTFYYGVFEYPKRSGNWYTGKHEPIITKELFDATQEQMQKHIVKVNNKEFAFTRLMKCGLCGSGITAEQKIKKQKNGNVHRYIYYSCAKTRDRFCKCGYINELDLVKQFEKLIGTIDINEIGIKEKIKIEVERFKKFQQALLGVKDRVVIADIDIRNYAKYILREGSILEKRELLGCFQSRLMLNNKLLTLKS
ncbi:MAG: recombinase family protein [Candidatus Komeilibacteria bacterium]|jgi:site-specific DNA recombinase|nr:recombinase family protein [Candidatus Komeilibacteria bacterium]MBT4447760.1 recombinase family protein [Candidatus Komeilibacteria bacterium]